ncbi:Glyoxylate reductase [Thermoanaerobacterium xylanolyticum LX-11]|uniref:Glyoxylate reductase n=1 Tax=Thermoanaerobacterium xylanolyticum (strain ATCC 49914 / DSM 7097 / LX-11) TaxID=858215 RepID=F6BJT3_THEXL|nr:phosphoglycerate dehydrogenase [Thermoanaerobacterium xylanolyticum]AEF16990.1 Glyoxylate reductase [Thermoanaerobacterium xylanolyticum LX-11]
MKKWKVVATAVTFGKINKEPLKRLEEFGCEVILNPFGRPLTNEEMIEYASDADALIVGNDKVTSNVIENCKNLKVIAKHGVGVDGIDIKTANRLGIIVTNAPASNNQEVADLAFGLLIMLARGLYQANYDTKAGRWIKPTGISLYKKIIGIVGLGAIGTAAAKRAKGFDMNILGYDIKENPSALEIGVKYVALEELLSKSDFVTLHLPLTNNTLNILNADRLKIIKKGAILVNTARSQLIDYDALYKSLVDGTLKGYATDVYDFEPPAHLPLFDLPNVILTPHIGGTTIESNRRMGDTAVDNVIAVLKGQTPPNIVTSK